LMLIKHSVGVYTSRTCLAIWDRVVRSTRALTARANASLSSISCTDV
jgi:hypothetical protein